MRSVDRWLVFLGAALLVAGLAWGASWVDPETDALRLAFAERAADALPLDAPDALAGAVAVEALPAGARIDPNTLELTGIELAPDDGSEVVDWKVLASYEYQPDLAGLPERLAALDGRKVTMAGFLLPLYEFDDIREFNLVASHWSCCFGVAPGLNGWVQVTLRAGEPGLRNTTEPLRVTGTFRVRETKEAGYVVSIYALEDATATVLRF